MIHPSKTSRLAAAVCLLSAITACIGVLTGRAAGPAPGMLLLDGAVVGAEVIIVGERGAIFRSSDGARTWQQADSTVHATLTGVSFLPGQTAKEGWAVGHDAVIIATADGGRTWAKQFQGENLQDSFLDVLALDARRVIAVGAYGLFLASTDAGRTWARRKLTADDFHLNRLTRGSGGTLYLAGEHGTLLRSSDDGLTWTSIAAPYDGSFYGILPLEGGELLAHGLRGHVYRSVDAGGRWERVPAPQATLVAAALELKNHTIVIGGQARGLLISRDFGHTFTSHPGLTTAVSRLLELADGTLIALGEAGVSRLAGTPR